MYKAHTFFSSHTGIIQQSTQLTLVLQMGGMTLASVPPTLFKSWPPCNHYHIGKRTYEHISAMHFLFA